MNGNCHLKEFNYFSLEFAQMDSSITHIRPRFKLNISRRHEFILEEAKKMLKSQQKLKGRVIDNHIILDINEEDAHYWSPQLNFRVEEDEDDAEKSIMAGLIGPRPRVWTMFVFIYFSIGITGFFIFSMGVSKWMLGEYSPLLWALPIAIVFMLTAYIAGKQGESLGKDQIEVLKQFIRDLIKVVENKP